MREPIRVLIVDSHAIVRDGLRLLLTREDDIVVMGDAGTAADALQATARQAGMGGLDLVMTDLGLPDMAGPELARRLKAADPALRVLFLSLLQDADQITGLLGEIGDGYVLKQGASQDLLAAIRTVMAGGLYLSPAVARRVVPRTCEGPAPAQRSDRLSARERAVLGLLAGGTTSKALARTLGLHPKAVEHHRANILAKLRVANTAAAIRLAYEDGLLTAWHDGAA